MALRSSSEMTGLGYSEIVSASMFSHNAVGIRSSNKPLVVTETVGAIAARLASRTSETRSA